MKPLQLYKTKHTGTALAYITDDLLHKVDLLTSSTGQVHYLNCTLNSLLFKL